MAKIMVYNPGTNRMEVYYRGLYEPMPYARYLTVKEFRGSSRSDILWTDKRAMEAWNTLRLAYGKPIDIGYAFKRISEGGHGLQSQHYAGLSFDMAQKMTPEERDDLRDLATRLDVFGYVEPKALTPTWVHVDRRLGKPACPTGGYPLIKLGNRGVYTAVLQDALNHLGYNVGTIDGDFGNRTRNAVILFQKDNNLSADGIVGCGTWTKLTQSM